MEYFSLKRNMKSWNQERSIYAYGSTIAPDQLSFAAECPFSICDFVNIKDRAISFFCVEITASCKDTFHSLEQKILKKLKNKM